MKVRVGLGLGINQLLTDPSELAQVIDAVESSGLDSLWVSERVVGPALDPLTALAYAAARTERIKLGTSVLVLPGRNPILLAKQVATVDRLSGGRLLPIVDRGTDDPGEVAAFGIEPQHRTKLLEAGVATMRNVWAGAPGLAQFSSIHPRPLRRLPIWIGGRSTPAFERVGRIADGWLGSLLTPDEAQAAVAAINASAAAAGRAIDPEHFGTVILYSEGPRDARSTVMLARFRPDAEPSDLIPAGAKELDQLIRRYVAGGLSKFILVPTAPPASWTTTAAWLRAATAPVEASETLV